MRPVYRQYPKLTRPARVEASRALWIIHACMPLSLFTSRRTELLHIVFIHHIVLLMVVTFDTPPFLLPSGLLER